MLKIYDISQEVFGCAVFPGDPKPEKKVMMKISDGEVCNLSAFSMCAHNGTHVDAPLHFIDGKNSIDRVDLDRLIGPAYVADHAGPILREDAEQILEDAKKSGNGAEERILVRGKAYLTAEGAKVFAERRIKLFGNESQTVGPEYAPMEVHLIMLGAEIVLLEGIRLSRAESGTYLLNAAPLNLGGAEGAPCRAVLLREET